MNQRVTPGRAALVVVLIAIPLFFWFRFLYIQYIWLPDQVSPQMRAMRDAMMARTPGKAHRASPVANASSVHTVGDAKKGGTQHTD